MVDRILCCVFAELMRISNWELFSLVNDVARRGRETCDTVITRGRVQYGAGGHGDVVEASRAALTARQTVVRLTRDVWQFFTGELTEAEQYRDRGGHGYD